MTKEQVQARHGVLPANANEPFWRRPLPPIRRPSDDPLADVAVTLTETLDTDPLADADPGVPSKSLENFEPPHANGTAPPHDDAAGSAPQPEIPTPHSSNPAPAAAEFRNGAPPPILSIADAQRNLIGTQLRVQRATDGQREARGRVALALEKFQRATMQTCTPEQLVRQHIESENQLRADRAAGKIPPRGAQRRLGSEVDRFAFYTRANGRGAGGGRAFARGAAPASLRGRTIVPKE
jgi:hypothetical protein